MNATQPLHVYPIDDLKEHKLEGYHEWELCDCNPRVDRSGGQPLVIHNSYDGREHKELDHSKEECPICARS